MRRAITRRPRFAYSPFGSGPGSGIGARLARRDVPSSSHHRAALSPEVRRQDIVLLKRVMLLLRESACSSIAETRLRCSAGLPPTSVRAGGRGALAAAEAQIADAMAMTAKGVALRHGWTDGAAAKTARAAVRTAVKAAEVAIKNQKRRG
jgi:hypothetical protein